MRQRVLQTLTWATVSGAVASAFWLASADLGWSEGNNPLAVPEAAFRLVLPSAEAHSVPLPGTREIARGSTATSGSGTAAPR